MRRIPSDFDPEVVSAIDARLATLAAHEGVAVPWAVESGSRAWGFASPDSDYDCRFFFVRPQRDYADLWPRRDVLETPVEGLLDVNGWDLRKAVRLATSGNATVGEWLRSPWVYTGAADFRDELLALVESVADRVRVRAHYRHVGSAQWARALGSDDTVVLKRVFYAVRPALTVRWLDAHPGVPPMTLDELLDQVPVPLAVAEEIAALRDLKAQTRELGRAPVPGAIAAWVEDTFRAVEERAPRPDPQARARATAGFLDLLARWAPDTA